MGKGYHWLEGTTGDDTFDLTTEPYSFFGYTKSGLGYHVETGDGEDAVYGTEHNDWLDGQAHRAATTCSARTAAIRCAAAPAATR